MHLFLLWAGYQVGYGNGLVARLRKVWFWFIAQVGTLVRVSLIDLNYDVIQDIIKNNRVLTDQVILTS